MIGADEGLRIEAGACAQVTATVKVATEKRYAPNASHATGMSPNQFCQYVYSKPGALFSVKSSRCGPLSFAQGSRVCLIGRAMVWISRTN
jgi:hypothetical protein